MSSPAPGNLWTMRFVFACLTLVIMLGNLLPLQTVSRGWAGPDMLFCFAMVWSVRRPEFVPIPLLAAVFFVADLILFRPPGLAAALMLVACYDLQNRMLRLRDAGFAAEWGRAAVLIIGATIAYRIALTIFFLPAPPVLLSLYQTIATILFYPVAIGVSAVLFGVRLSQPGDLDRMGQRQ